MALASYPKLPPPWARHGKGWRWAGAPPATGGAISIQPTRRGWTARHGELRGIYDTFAVVNDEGELQEYNQPTHFLTPDAAAHAAVVVWGLMAKQNPEKGLDAATVQAWASALDKAARGLNLNDEEDRTVFRIRVAAAAKNAKVGTLRDIVVALGGARPAPSRLAATRALAATRLPQRRIKNDGARAVAREYSKILGIPKSEMRKLTGKKFAKMQKSKRRALTPQQEQKLLKLLPSYPEDIRAGILLMLTLGLRVAELAAIRPDSTGVNVVGKGNKARHVPFKVDPRSRSVVKVATGAANPSRLQAACRKMQKELPGLTPHVLRHTFATRAMQHGVDPKVLQAALGHDKFRTTIVYLSTIQK